MITQQGIFSMNRVGSNMTLTEYDEALEYDAPHIAFPHIQTHSG